MSFVQGAGALLNYFSVDYALVRRGRLRAGETVLVHGAAGGIGTAAVQLARALGARVVAVVSTAAKAEVAKAAGANEVVLAEGFVDAVRALTDGVGVDVVLDPVGGDRFRDSLRCLRPEGRLLVVGFTEGAIPSVPAHRVLNGDVDVIGSAWGRVWHRDRTYLATQWARLAPLFADGRLDVVVSSTHPLDRASVALRELADRRARGKVVLTVG
jgi:NADPH2:quinone reductase